MKKVSILVMSLLVLGLAFSSCEKKKPQLKINPSAIEVIIGESVTVEITGGISPYTAKEADKTIATATVENKELKITGVKEGQTTIVVTDKDGTSGSIIVKVIKDPFEDAKKDAVTRIVWDNFKKVQGTDKGTYTMVKAADKSVTFTWKSEDAKNSAVLTFNDPNNVIKKPSAKATRADNIQIGKLSITLDGQVTEHNLTAWRLVQAKAVKEGDPVVYWIAFRANNKNGLCVASLAE